MIKSKIKEHCKFPCENRYIFFVYAILSFFIFLKGCGYREIYDISLYAFLSLQICNSKRLYSVVSILLLLVIHLFFPGVSLLWGYCALMFSIGKQTLPYAALSVGLWFFEAFGIILYAPSLIIVVVIMSTFMYCLPCKWVRWAIIMCSTISIVLTIYSMPCWKTKVYAEKYVESVYSPSDVFCKITNTSYIDCVQMNKDTKIIRSMPFYTKIPITQSGICIFEVNYQGSFEDVDSTIWQQPISWHDNQLIGNQYYLEAIRHDGGLYSNKGVTLTDQKGSVQLAYMESLTRETPLIVRHDDVLYLHDSDYSSSFLANYQRCFLNELVGNGERPNHIRILNVLFAIMTCLICWVKCKNGLKWSVLLLPFIGLALYHAYLKPIKGEIRLVGEITNSHENCKFDGVVKKIVFAGFNYTVGNYDTKILVVKKGKKAIVETEKLVLAEEDCVINVDGKIFTVNNNPIGNVNGIVDARQWLYEGKLYNGVVVVNDVTLIATGSPALQQWKGLIKY